MNKICFRGQKCKCMLESYEASFFLQGGDIGLSQLVTLAVYLTDTILSQNNFLRAAVATHIEDAILRKAMLWCQINSSHSPPFSTSLFLSFWHIWVTSTRAAGHQRCQYVGKHTTCTKSPPLGYSKEVGERGYPWFIAAERHDFKEAVEKVAMFSIRRINWSSQLCGFNQIPAVCVYVHVWMWSSRDMHGVCVCVWKGLQWTWINL